MAKHLQMVGAEGVVFDMDGLLLDTERLFMRAYQLAASEFGVGFSKKMYLKMIGHRADASQRILRAEIGADAPAEEIIDAARRHFYTLIEKDGIPLRPGVEPVLDFLAEKGYPMAVATSTLGELATRKLERVGLLDRFAAIVSGDMVENGKPAPDIFLEAARRIGVAPERCICLEDSVTGLAGAREAGMITVLIPDLVETDTRLRIMAGYIFDSLNDFLHQLQQELLAAG